MSFISDLFHTGGPFMWPILLAFLLGLGLAVTRATYARGPSFREAGAAVVVFLLASGLTGTFVGMRTALRAVFHASVETQQLLLMAGLSVALVTMVAAAVAAMALVLAQRVSWGRRDPDSPAAAGLSWTTVCALAASLLALGAGTQALSSLFAGLAHEGIAVLPDLGGSGISSVFGGESTALHVEETLTASVMSARAAVRSWLNVSIVAGYVAMILSLGSILTNLVRDVRASGIRVVVTSTQA